MGLGRLIYDSAKNRVPMEYSEYSVAEREDAIRAKLFEVLEVEGYDAKTFRKALRRHKVEVFEIIEEVVENILANGDYLRNAFFTQWVEVRNLALGDENRFYIEGEKELEVAEFSGSHYDLKRQRFDVGAHFSVGMKDYGVKVYEYAERIAAGRVDFGVIVAEISKAVDKKMVDVAEATFIQAMDAIPSAFKLANVDSTTPIEKILEVAQHVESANGEGVIFLGTKTAIRKLNGVIDVNMYSNNMKDEMNNNGVIPVFQGYTCMELAQGHKLGTFDFVMPNNKIYIISGAQKPVKIVLEGTTETKEISDGTTNADGSYEQVIRYKMGSAVMYGGVIGCLDLK